MNVNVQQIARFQAGGGIWDRPQYHPLGSRGGGGPPCLFAFIKEKEGKKYIKNFLFSNAALSQKLSLNSTLLKGTAQRIFIRCVKEKQNVIVPECYLMHILITHVV